MAHTAGNMFWKAVNPSFKNYKRKAITQGLQRDATQKGLTWSIAVSVMHGNGVMVLTLYIAFL